MQTIARSLVLVTLLLGACGTVQTANQPGQSGGDPSKSGFTTFPDMPMPGGFDLDMKRTMVVGGNESWFGQMTFTTRFGANEMFDFYKQQMTAFGWEEITSIRAPVSVLTYSRQDRIATIQVQSRMVYGSEVLITVSPRGAPGGGSGGGIGLPSGTGAPVPPVQTIR
jgi:hypothetical protein